MLASRTKKAQLLFLDRAYSMKRCGTATRCAVASFCTASFRLVVKTDTKTRNRSAIITVMADGIGYILNEVNKDGISRKNGRSLGRCKMSAEQRDERHSLALSITFQDMGAYGRFRIDERQRSDAPEISLTPRGKSGLESRDATGIDLAATYGYVLSFATGVAAKVVASWIYDKLKSRAKSLKVADEEVEVIETEIERVISERIRTRKTKRS